MTASPSLISYDQRPYRLNVGIMVFNPQGLIFIGKRIQPKEEAWQMPQGGIDDGEDPRKAAFRELIEETGIKQVDYVSETMDWLTYDLPPEKANLLWNGAFRGQQQKWYLVFFTGKDSDIDLTHHEPEFETWEWATPEIALDRVVGFKKGIYEQAFAQLLPAMGRFLEFRDHTSDL